MFWATMPETTIHKKANTLTWKHQVWVSEHLILPAPAGNLVISKDLDELFFSGSVSRALYKGHYS
jgi:hypothetical protein